MFTSLWVFSIILAASATFTLSALYVPAVIIDLYKLFILIEDFFVDPETTFTIFLISPSFDPGFNLSGLKP